VRGGPVGSVFRGLRVGISVEDADPEAAAESVGGSQVGRASEQEQARLIEAWLDRHVGQ
jgi:hypothetical protein